MITRNRRQDPLATLEDVRKASLGVPLVVVDNGSMDHSAAAVRHRYRDVLVISLDHNAGAVARHIAVDTVDTRFVASCDDDSWWDGRLLALATKILASPHPR